MYNVWYKGFDFAVSIAADEILSSYSPSGTVL